MTVDVDLTVDVDDVLDADTPARLIDTHVHGFECKFMYASDGLSPYFYLRKLMLETHDGYINDDIEFDVRGETWVLETAYYPDGKSGLKCPADWQIDSIYEFWFKTYKKDDEEIKATYHVAPAWQGMETKNENSGNPTLPAAIDDGVRVDVNGSNVQDLSKYLRIFRSMYRKIVGGRNRRYFRPRDVHPYSTILQLELYVRLRRDIGKNRIINAEGIIQRIANVLSTGGSEKGELKWDDEEEEGYYRHVTVDQAGSRELITGHQYGKRIKHYHPKYTRSNPDDPLYHPKIEIPFSKKMNGGNGVPWTDRKKLQRELDETLVNVMHWAHVPVQGIPGIYIPDDYWTVTESERDIALYDDPTPEIEATQEGLAMRYFVREPAMDSTFEIFQELVTDGGRDVKDVEQNTNYSQRTVYRFLERMGDIVESHNGHIEWKSEFLRKKIKEIVDQAEAAAERLGYQAVDVINREHGTGAGALARWFSRYAIDHQDDVNRVRFELQLGHFSEREMLKIIRQGYQAWKDAGRNAKRFQEAIFSWTSSSGEPQQRRAILRNGGEMRVLGRVALSTLERQADR